MNKSTSVDSFKAASRKYSDTSILMHEAISRKAGLSGTDHKYLGLLIQEGPMTAGELSQRTGLTGGAITTGLKKRS
jgi:DNA-binding MarR family transcriptional regulator